MAVAPAAAGFPFVDGSLEKSQRCNPGDPDELIGALWELYGVSIMAADTDSISTPAYRHHGRLDALSG